VASENKSKIKSRTVVREKGAGLNAVKAEANKKSSDCET